MLGAIFFLTFISTLFIVYIIYTIFFNKREIINRMHHYLNPDKNTEKTDRESSIAWREGLNAVGKTIGKSKVGGKYIKSLENQLVQAHVALKAEEFITINIIVGILGLILGLIVFPIKMVGVLHGIVSLSYPLIYLNGRKKKILKKIDQQLPDTIMLLSNSMKAGYSFLQAVDVASKELPPPISLEFKQIMREVNLGLSTEVALESLSKRAQSEDLQLVILAVLIQRQIGGNLSEILDNISDTIRARIKVKGEISILTAQGRISGWIISLMPVALAAGIFALNPSYIMVLFTTPIGWAMLGASAIMEVIGIFFIRKIIQIEV